MLPEKKPQWLTFDCYGTLIQWDEGLLKAVETILAKNHATVDAKVFIAAHDKYEHALELEKPHRSFKSVSGEALKMTMAELGLKYEVGDDEILTSSISKMPPFPEVVGALASLKAQGFKLCIISNTDDDIIAGNVAQMGGHIDKVITAQQASWYKPSRHIFEHAWKEIGVDAKTVLHICASPHLDHAAARELHFGLIWIDRGTGRKLLPDYMPDKIFPRLDLAAEFLQQRY